MARRRTYIIMYNNKCRIMTSKDQCLNSSSKMFITKMYRITMLTFMIHKGKKKKTIKRLKNNEISLLS